MIFGAAFKPVVPGLKALELVYGTVPDEVGPSLATVLAKSTNILNAPRETLSGVLLGWGAGATQPKDKLRAPLIPRAHRQRSARRPNRNACRAYQSSRTGPTMSYVNSTGGLGKVVHVQPHVIVPWRQSLYTPSCWPGSGYMPKCRSPGQQLGV